MHPRICRFVCIMKVPHHAKGALQKVDGTYSTGISIPWLMLGDLQGTETTVSAHTAHPGCPALPRAATACHVPPGRTCAHTYTFFLHYSMEGSFLWPLIHWALSKAALQKLVQRQKAWLASHPIWKSGINRAGRIFCYMLLSCFIWLQTFKQETLPPKTGKLILCIILDTQTYK